MVAVPAQDPLREQERQPSMARHKRRSSCRRQVASVALQKHHIRRRFRGFSIQSGRGTLTCRGTLQPQQTSPCYEVQVSYKMGRVPRVVVRSPALDPEAPHRYADGSLCLYWPEEWLWRSDALLADTIIPWTALWLCYYELWLDTAVWLGPSSHRGKPGGEEPV